VCRHLNYCEVRDLLQERINDLSFTIAGLTIKRDISVMRMIPQSLALLVCLLVAMPVEYVAAQSERNQALFADAKAVRDKALEAKADVLSPVSFPKAEENYLNAVRSSNRGSEPDRFTNQLNKAEVQYQEALQNANVAQVALTDILESREAAAKVEASSRASDLWAAGERYLGMSAKLLEQGRRGGGSKEADIANRNFRQAELVSIKEILLTEARNLIAQATKNRDERYASLTLTKAQSFLTRAERILELDRYNTEEVERLANEASYEARHAMNIAKNVRLVKDGTRNEEQLILHWEEPLKRLSGTLQIEPRLDDGYEWLTGEMEAQITGLLQAREQLKADQEDQREIVANQQKELVSLQQELASLQLELAQMDELLANIAPRADTSSVNPTGSHSVVPPRGTPNPVAINELFSRDEAIVLQENSRTILRLVGLEFPPGSATLPENNTVIQKLRDGLSLYPDSNITLEGHTDSLGETDQNRRLSQLRAEALQTYIVNNIGISPSRVTAIGKGESQPIASNETVAGRTANRRIDVVILPN
jgi:outer membrane protein OmpA-like peptidoglycan-associated protein